jgi:hypothetical protein
VAFFAAPGFGGWKNRRQSQARPRGMMGKAIATAAKIVRKRYGEGVMGRIK